VLEFELLPICTKCCEKCGGLLSKNGLCPLGRASSPWSRDYRPESDVSPELSPTDASYYQSLIGTLRWIVELGRADLVMETSCLASMMALPREGQAIFHMFAFLGIMELWSLIILNL